jgi:hypothetical protein
MTPERTLTAPNMRDDKSLTVYPSSGLYTPAEPKLNSVRVKTLSCPASLAGLILWSPKQDTMNI